MIKDETFNLDPLAFSVFFYYYPTAKESKTECQLSFLNSRHTRMNSVLCGLDLHQKFSVSSNVLVLVFWLVIWCWFFVWLGFFQIHIMNQKNVNFENMLLPNPFSVTAFQSLVHWHFTVFLLSFGIGVFEVLFLCVLSSPVDTLLGYCIFIVVSVWISCTYY